MVFSFGLVCASLAVEKSIFRRWTSAVEFLVGWEYELAAWNSVQEWWERIRAATGKVAEKTWTAFTLWLGLMWWKGRIADHYGVPFASPVPFNCTPCWSLEWNIMVSLKPGHTSYAPSHLGSTKTQEQTGAGILASSVWSFCGYFTVC